MPPRHTHLLLALSRKGFGESILGLRLACELRDQGDQVVCLAHDSSATLFANTGLSHFTFGFHAAPLLQMFITDSLREYPVSSIILADYYAATLFFVCARLDPDILTQFSLPLIAIDTWDSINTPEIIDVAIDDSRHRTFWRDISMSIYPVPFLRPAACRATYGSLPSKATLGGKTKAQVRENLGLKREWKVVLFCTAEWQHPNYESQGDSERRMATSMPMLVGDYLSRMGEQVHMVHVGPLALNIGEHLHGRYHWMPALSPESFANIVASADLLLSANISATTITKAMVSEVPTLVLQNSVSAESVEEAEEKMKNPPTERLRQWLNESMPLFPFALWPVGYHRLLEPLLQDNPYMSALEVVELLDEKAVEGALARLLFDEGHRAKHRHRQSAYLDQVRSLPTGAHRINQILGEPI